MFPFRLLRNCSVAPFRPSSTLFDRFLPSPAVDMAKKRKSKVTADHDEATPSEVDHDAHVPEDTQKTLYEVGFCSPFTFYFANCFYSSLSHGHSDVVVVELTQERVMSMLCRISASMAVYFSEIVAFVYRKKMFFF